MRTFSTILAPKTPPKPRQPSQGMTPNRLHQIHNILHELDNETHTLHRTLARTDPHDETSRTALHTTLEAHAETRAELENLLRLHRANAESPEDPRPAEIQLACNLAGEGRASWGWDKQWIGVHAPAWKRRRGAGLAGGPVDLDGVGVDWDAPARNGPPGEDVGPGGEAW